MSSIPAHYLSPCFTVCVYFERPVPDAVGMVHSLAVKFAVSCPRNAWVRSSGLVLSRPDLLTARGNAKKGAFHLFKQSVRMRDFEAYARAIQYPAGKHLVARVEFQPFSKVDGFSMHRCIVSYDSGSGWDYSQVTGNPGASLVMSTTPWGGGDSMLPGALFDECLRTAAQFGRVCHGVIDHDIYLGNQHGTYYQASHSPTTRERSLAADAWSSTGGDQRPRLCRHPREGLILGSHFADTMGMTDPDSLARWKSRHGFTDTGPTLELHESGLYLLRCTHDPTDFSNSIRQCSHTWDISNRVHNALCEDGFSLPNYAIHDKRSVRMYDSISAQYVNI